jgi:hypothetical protein
MKKDDLAGMIYDALADAPGGMSIYDIAERVNMPVYACRKAMRSTRLTLAEGDTLFVIAEPQGPREPWLYQLVDGKTLVDAEHSGWTTNRIGDAQSRVHLLSEAMGVAARATDGRSIPGRKARVMAKALHRLDEDLTEIDEAGRS